MILPVLHMTDVCPVAVENESDLAGLPTQTFQAGTTCFARTTQVLFVWDPLSGAATVAGSSVAVITGGAWIAIGSVASGLGPFNTIAQITLGSRLLDVSASQMAVLERGSIVWVESVKDYWRWDPTSTLTANNITVCNPTANGANPGRFIREGFASLESQLQTTWIIDASNTSALASDENDGLTATTPLLTDTERNRRTGWSQNTWPAAGAYHIRYISNIDEIWLEGRKPPATVVFLHGNVTDNVGLATLYTGNIDAITALNRTAAAGGQPILITSNALPVSWTASALIGSRIRRTSDNATAWPIKDLGAKQARTSEWTVVTAYTVPYTEPTSAATPALNDTFIVESLVKINKVNINFLGGRGVTNNFQQTVFESLDVGTDFVVGSGCSEHIIFTGCIYRCSLSINGMFQGLFFDSCRLTVPSGSTFNTPKAIRIQITGGYGDVATMNWQSIITATMSRFMSQGSRNVFTCQSGNDLEGWAVTQLGAFDCAAGAGIDIKSPGGLIISGATGILWGNGNAGAALEIRSNSSMFYSNTTIAAGTNINIVGASDCQFGGSRTAVPAFDQATSLYTAARTLSFANILATVAAGGFCASAGAPQFIDPVSGAGILPVAA